MDKSAGERETRERGERGGVRKRKGIGKIFLEHLRIMKTTRGGRRGGRRGGGKGGARNEEERDEKREGERARRGGEPGEPSISPGRWLGWACRRAGSGLAPSRRPLQPATTRYGSSPGSLPPAPCPHHPHTHTPARSGLHLPSHHLPSPASRTSISSAPRLLQTLKRSAQGSILDHTPHKHTCAAKASFHRSGLLCSRAGRPRGRDCMAGHLNQSWGRDCNAKGEKINKRRI